MEFNYHANHCIANAGLHVSFSLFTGRLDERVCLLFKTLFVCTRLQFVFFFFRRYYFSAEHVSDKNEAMDQEKELELHYMCVCVLFPRKEYAFCLIINLYLNIL